MAEKSPQTFENHARILPAYHYVAFPLFADQLLLHALPGRDRLQLGEPGGVRPRGRAHPALLRRAGDGADGAGSRHPPRGDAAHARAAAGRPAAAHRRVHGEAAGGAAVRAPTRNCRRSRGRCSTRRSRIRRPSRRWSATGAPTTSAPDGRRCRAALDAVRRGAVPGARRQDVPRRGLREPRAAAAADAIAALLRDVQTYPERSATAFHIRLDAGARRRAARGGTADRRASRGHRARREHVARPGHRRRRDPARAGRQHPRARTRVPPGAAAVAAAATAGRAGDPAGAPRRRDRCPSGGSRRPPTAGRAPS